MESAVPQAEAEPIDQLLERAHARLDAGDAANAERSAGEALDRARAAGDTKRAALAHRALAAVARDRENSVGELDHSLAALQTFERLGDEREAAETERRLASFYLMLDLAQARRYAESSLATFRALDDRIGIAEATGNLGQIEFEAGNAGHALELFEEAVARCEELRNAACEAANLSRASYAQWKLGRPGEMLAALERAMALALPQSNPRTLSDLRTDIGLAKLELGRIEEGRRDLEEALRLAESIGATRQQITTLAYLSRAYEMNAEPALALAAERRRSALFGDRFSDQLNLQIASAQSRGDLERQAIETERIRERERRRAWTLGFVVVLALALVAALATVAWIRHAAARKIELRSADLAEALSQLRAKEAEARSLFENTGEGIAYVDLGEQFIAVNPAAERIFGVAAGTLVGRNLLDFLDQDGHRLLAEQTSRRRHGAQDTYELDIVRPDGEAVSMLVTATPKTDDGGTVTGTLGVFRDITESRLARLRLSAANEELAGLVRALRARDERLTRITRLNEMLLGCATRLEAFEVIARSAQEVLDGEAGFLAMVSPEAEERFDVVSAWGEEVEQTVSFSRDDCWAIRRGQAHESAGPHAQPACAHVGRSDAAVAVCMPLVVRGELIGLLHVRSARVHDGAPGEAFRSALAESIKLGLSNLALRESLEEQAVRDPLTGLFNRRFLDASLPRELERARRSKRPLACAVVDIDDFKRFNEEFGHEAGDLVLREVGRLLRTSLRSTDLACRLGGDEIAVILPDSTAANAHQRFAEIRRKVAKTRLIHLGRALDVVSLSVGLAEADGSASSPEEILRVADRALMEAKQAGKNRIHEAQAGA